MVFVLKQDLTNVKALLDFEPICHSISDQIME